MIVLNYEFDAPTKFVKCMLDNTLKINRLFTHITTQFCWVNRFRDDVALTKFGTKPSRKN